MALKLLIISFIGLLLLITFRVIEIRIDRDILSKNFRDKTDRVLVTFFVSIRKISIKFSNLIKNSLKNILSILIHKFVFIWEKFVIKSQKIINLIKGKGVLKNKGSASFFLSTISEHKKELRK